MLILRESNYAELYKYKGPVFDKFNNFIDNVDMNSSGPSKEKVISQIKWRLSKEYGPAIKLDLKYLNLIDVYDSELEKQIKFKNRRCETCGTRLTDAGDCPKCDFGERDEDV